MKSKVLEFRKGFAVVAENKMAEAATMVIPPGDKQGGPDNNHKGADQWLFVISGQGSATVEGEKTPLKESTLILIVRGENHEIENTGRKLTDEIVEVESFDFDTITLEFKGKSIILGYLEFYRVPPEQQSIHEQCLHSQRPAI